MAHRKQNLETKIDIETELISVQEPGPVNLTCNLDNDGKAGEAGEACHSIYGVEGGGGQQGSTRGGGGNSAALTVTSNTATTAQTADHNNVTANGHTELLKTGLNFLVKVACVWAIELLLDKILEQINK